MQELSLNVLDIVQNSISAGASVIEITVRESIVSDTLYIGVKDNGSGMTKEQLEKVIDPFYTTRTTRRIGFGVPFFKMSAEMTGGSFTINSTLGEGTIIEATYTHSHIDRMPLGDINGTVLTLIQLNPDIDFVYSYSYEENSFTADTREFRQVLGDIPLSSPEVLEFIRAYLGENTADIQNN